MNEYKRLTGQKWTDYIDLTKEYGYSYIYKRLYELEDKIMDGTLIKLPCKVGDRIWAILGNNIFSRKVKSIVIRGDGYTIKTSNTNGWKDLEPYYNAEFGVIWFLTKAEAEAKLKELQEKQK